MTDRLTPEQAANFAAAKRKLTIHFFGLGLIGRYEAAMAAGLWDNSDDSLQGQALWAVVFDRAEKSEKLQALWDAVAREDQTLAEQINPFTKTS